MFNPALCPKCEELILVSQRDIFVVCPKCEENISGEEGKTKLKDWVGDPKNVTEVIAMCIDLEDKFGPSVSTAILVIAEAAFPLNEQIAYLNLKYQDFTPTHVRNHLNRFAKIKTKKYLPWAEEFLSNTLTVRNMEHSALFEEYITNKVLSKMKDRYIEMLRHMKASYTKTATGSPAIITLYGFYSIFSAVNIGMMISFLFLSLWFVAFILIGMGIMAIQLFIFFLHNRIFGNRTDVSDKERLFMVVYMSSIAIAIGGVFLGIFVSI